jgi:recombination protein RecT
MNTETPQKPTTPAIPRSVKSWLTSDYFRQQVALTLPKHLTPDRFTRVALTALTRVPKLAECTPESVMKCMMTCSELGIEPDGRRAHLIPFKNECTLILDYKGLVELAKRSGDVSSIYAQIVCENDEFTYDTGQVHHTIDFRKERGPMYAAYSIITFKDGGKHSEVMTRREIDGIRSRSKAANNGPWVTDYNEMAKKTVFRRASKWITLSPEIQDALDADADTPAFNGSLVAEGLDVQRPAGRGQTSYVQGGAKDASGVDDDIPFDAAPRQVSDEPAAPVPAAEPAPKLAAGSEPLHTVQESLQELVIGGGFTFDDLLKWGQATGNIPDGDSLAGFGEVPAEICKRLIRAKVGLLRGLAEVKGGVPAT